jgi:hypothetical protein
MRTRQSNAAYASESRGMTFQRDDDLQARLLAGHPRAAFPRARLRANSFSPRCGARKGPATMKPALTVLAVDAALCAGIIACALALYLLMGAR